MQSRTTGRGLRVQSASSKLLRLVFGLTTMAAATVQAQGTNWVAIYNGSAPETSSTVVDAPASIGTLAPINLSTWTGSAANFAAASGGTQTLRGLVAGSGVGVGADQLHPQSFASFHWVSEVLPSASAPTGSPITVYFDLHVDGKFDTRLLGTSATPSSYQIDVGAFTTMRFSVSDMQLNYDPEGDPHMVFHYTGQTELAATDGGAFEPRSLRSTYRNEVTAIVQGGTPWAWAGNGGGDVTDLNVMPVGQLAFSVNTGVLRFAFDTFVGNHLALDGNFRAEAWGFTDGGVPWQAMADFANTFDVELSASDPGVTFSGVTPGVYQPVPEPATLALMLAGLAAVALRLQARRQAAN